jgi:hypothetical protein
VKCAWAILSWVASPAVLYISTLSHKRQHSGEGGREGKLLNKMCGLVFFSTFVSSISHSKKK